MNRALFQSSHEQGPRRTARRRGFTLLELVLVLLVIGTALALAAPRMTGFWRGVETRDAAVDFLTVTRWAREKAVSNGTIYRLVVNVINRSYQLTMLEGEEFIEVPGSFGGEIFLPRDGQIELVEPRDRTYVDFFPDGRSDIATVRITDGIEDILIECSSPSALYRILPPEEAQRR